MLGEEGEDCSPGEEDCEDERVGDDIAGVAVLFQLVDLDLQVLDLPRDVPHLDERVRNDGVTAF